MILRWAGRLSRAGGTLVAIRQLRWPSIDQGRASDVRQKLFREGVLTVSRGIHQGGPGIILFSFGVHWLMQLKLDYCPRNHLM